MTIFECDILIFKIFLLDIFSNFLSVCPGTYHVYLISDIFLKPLLGLTFSLRLTQLWNSMSAGYKITQAYGRLRFALCVKFTPILTKKVVPCMYELSSSSFWFGPLVLTHHPELRGSNTRIAESLWWTWQKIPYFHFGNLRFVTSLHALGVEGLAKQMCRDSSNRDSSPVYINQSF